MSGKKRLSEHGAPDESGSKQHRGRFRPGKSGNPKGRPLGSGLAAELRRAIAADADAIVAALVKRAKDGDVTAARVLLDRVSPPLKATREPAALPGMNEAGGLAARAEAVLEALGGGAMPADEAAEVLAAVASAAKVIETDELEARIRALEERCERT